MDASTSVRWYPKVRSMDAGRPATSTAKRARAMPAASVTMWAASARRARLPDKMPPITSAIMNPLMRTNARMRLLRLADLRS